MTSWDDIKTLLVLPTLCVGNSPAHTHTHTKGQWCFFCVLFVVRLNKLLTKQSICQSFEAMTLMWRLCNGIENTGTCIRNRGILHNMIKNLHSGPLNNERGGKKLGHFVKKNNSEAISPVLPRARYTSIFYQNKKIKWACPKSLLVHILMPIPFPCVLKIMVRKQNLSRCVK